MRIFIKTEKGKKIKVPVPMWTIRLGARFPIERIARRYMKEKDAKYLDLIDWRELRKLISSLVEYKGLILVDVKDSDGTEVLIQI